MPDGSGSRLVGEREWRTLELAEADFDVFVTLDTNLQYQQNLTGREIAIVVLVALSNRLVNLSPQFAACAAAVGKVLPGDILTVGEAV